MTAQTLANDVTSHGHEESYLNAKKGIGSWIVTLDHKRIGIMYLISIGLFFFVGGMFALLVRTKLLTGGEVSWMTPKQYNEFFTLHGALMVFLVIIPGIPASLGNFALPLQLGAKDVAFPKLNLLSYYIYVFGALCILASLLLGAVDTGWTFYTPYSTTYSAGGTILVVTAVFILGFSSILTGLNFITTVHKLRAPGMGFFRMPLFVWGIYATAIVQVMATPVLAITLLLLIVERVLKVGIFDAELGGDPVLFQHFFWFYSHPAVYIMIPPGMAVISELITTFSQKKIFGYRQIAYSSVAIAVIGFLVWGHHMFVSGQSELISAIFSALTFLVAIPSGVKMFNWVTTMHKGSISWQTPMLWAMSFMFLFAIGGVTGVVLATLAVDVHLHDTYFVVSHFHYVMVGGTFMAFMGGIYYWWPKITGKMYNEKVGALAAWMVFIGFNTTFLAQFVMGSQGMPRRYYNYIDQFTIYHQISTAGSYILAMGFFLVLANWIHSLWKGPKAPKNPWHADTLDWTHTVTPPIEHNFHEQPVVMHDPYRYDSVESDMAKAKL